MIPYQVHCQNLQSLTPTALHILPSMFDSLFDIPLACGPRTP